MSVKTLRWVPWLLALLLLPCSAATARAAGEYRTAEHEGLRITIDSEWAPRAAPGYLPVRFDITNLVGPRVIEIIGQGSRYFRGTRGGQPGGIDIVQPVRLGRGDRVRLTIPVPVMADNENLRFEIREDGRTIERFNYTGFQSRSAAADASALVVAMPSSALANAAAAWRRLMTGRTTYVPPGASGGVVPPLDFVLEPARLPANWLGYTSLRAVLIGAMEWDLLDEAQRNALLTWTSCGGDLMIIDGNLTKVFPATSGSATVAPDLAVRAYFFGRIHATSSASITADGLAMVLTRAEKFRDLNFALPANLTPDWGSIKARGFRLPIPGVAGVPARTYLLILLVFAFVIGPANYWFLTRKRQQVLLVLTTPLISMLFIVLLAGYVLAGDGLGVRGRAATLTMLDQVRKHAATRASVSLYAAGMTPGGGLRFPRDVAVFAIGRDGAGTRDRQALDLTDSQRFAAGVIHARSPTNLEQIAFRPARERLTFSQDGSSMSVVNGFDTAISALVYRKANRTYALTAPLSPFGKGILRSDASGAATLVPSDVPLSARLAHLFANQPEGSYLAILDRSPFWDPGVSSVEERGSFHLVIGWPDGQP